MIMKARFRNECFICYRAIWPGSEIRKSRSGKWVHDECGKAAQAKAAVTAGLTFRGFKPNEWRIGSSPSNNRGGRA